MPLMCHIIQRCCKLTISVRVIPEICTGTTQIYTVVFHISCTKINCYVALLYKVNTLKVLFWFRKIENRQIIGFLVCNSFCDCQLSTFGGAVCLACYTGIARFHLEKDLPVTVVWELFLSEFLLKCHRT